MQYIDSFNIKMVTSNNKWIYQFLDFLYFITIITIGKKLYLNVSYIIKENKKLYICNKGMTEYIPISNSFFQKAQ